MLRHLMIGLAAVTLVSATLIPDDAAAGVASNSNRNCYRDANGKLVCSLQYQGQYGYGAGAGTVGAGAATYRNTYPDSNRDCYRDASGKLVCSLQYQGQFGPYRGNY